MVYMAKTDRWYLERVIWLVAGTFTLGSAIGAYFHTQLWLILTALVGINLLIFAFTGFCIMANILYALGVKPKIGCDVAQAGGASATRTSG